MTPFQALTASLAAATALGLGLLTPSLLATVEHARATAERVQAMTRDSTQEAAAIAFEIKFGRAPEGVGELIASGYLKPEFMQEDVPEPPAITPADIAPMPDPSITPAPPVSTQP